MEAKSSRASAVPPPQTTNPNAIRSTRKMVAVDVKYFLSVPGILKIVEIVLGIICAAVCGKALFAGNEFFLFVTIFFLIMSTILLFLHFATVPKLVTFPAKLQWVFLEFVYACIAAGFYAIAASVQVATAETKSRQACDVFGDMFSSCTTYNRYLASGIIAFINMFVYIADAYIHFRQSRTNQLQAPV